MAKEALLVGLVGGIVGSIPCISALNCCCFLPEAVVIWVGLGLALQRRVGPISFKGLLLAGMVAGITAGALAALGGGLLSMVMTSDEEMAMVRQILESAGPVPPELKELFADAQTMSVVGLLVNIPLYASGAAVVGVLAAWGSARTMLAGRVVDEG
jgi:hypothetical protein